VSWLRRNRVIRGEGLQNAGRERRVNLFHQALGAQLPEVITEGSEFVVSCRNLQRLQDMGMQLGSSEGTSGGQIAEADEGAHEGQLPGMIQLQSGNTFSVRQNRGLS
jgi:hypothetical protein